MKTNYKLKYEKNDDRWLAISNKDNEFPMRCGDMFQIKLGKILLSCRLEMDSNWYVISNGTKIKLHPKEYYEVLIQ